MNKSVVLAFVVQHQRTRAISVLQITQEYAFKVLPSGHGKHAKVMIEVSDSQDAGTLVLSLPVDSLTVIYGENGEGKTTLLLDLCRTLNRYRSDRPLGIIWRDKTTGRIRLDKGTQLDAVILKGPLTENEPARLDVAFKSVFYTTSPFESARRRALAASGTIDGTPSFANNSFNGTSLCRAAGSLPKDIPFIRSAKVQIEFSDLPKLEKEVEEFIDFVFPSDLNVGDSKKRHPSVRYREQLHSLYSVLSARTRLLLAIELYRARLDGPKEARYLLTQLFDRKEPLNGSQAVGRFLSKRESISRRRVATPSVLKAIEALKKVATSVAPDKLHVYSDLLNVQLFNVLEGLQEAENLGFLHWRFLDLSSGQVALLMLFASLASALEKLRSNDSRFAVLVVDEGEMFMHPAWQRKYLHDLMKFIEYFRAYFDEIHLILATHSLIVAGDAPPNRLFDVKTGKMRNGFAYGPREVLDDVYGVKEFAGDMAESLYEKIVDFIKGTAEYRSGREAEVRSIIKQIASPQLRTYLLGELDRMKAIQDA